MPSNDGIAGRPATRGEVANVAINASLAAITMAQALHEIRELLIGNNEDREAFAAVLAEAMDDLENSSDELEKAFDELVGWTADEGESK